MICIRQIYNAAASGKYIRKSLHKKQSPYRPTYAYAANWTTTAWVGMHVMNAITYVMCPISDTHMYECVTNHTLGSLVVATIEHFAISVCVCVYKHRAQWVGRGLRTTSIIQCLQVNRVSIGFRCRHMVHTLCVSNKNVKNTHEQQSD